MAKQSLRAILNRVERLVHFPKEMLPIHYCGVPHYESYIERIYQHWQIVEAEEKKTFPDYKKIEFDIINMTLLFGCLQDMKAATDEYNKEN